MRPGDSIAIQLADDRGDPMMLDMVEVTIAFYLNGRFRYAFGFGPTDKSGCVRVSYQEIENQRLESLRIQPWDYKTRLEESDPRVTISTRSGNELERAMKIAASFNRGTIPESVKWWAAANNRRIKCSPLDMDLLPGENLVSLPCSFLP